MAKTTKRQFKLFCDEVTKQCVRLGLLEWRLEFLHEDCGDAFAEVKAYFQDRVAVFTFNVVTCHIDPESWVVETALHEAIELLVMDIYRLAATPFKTEDEVECSKHTLVRRLEKLLR